jgi:Cd2+/Zn2+-exporting ATPase
VSVDQKTPPQKARHAIKQNLVFSLAVLGIAFGLAIPGILHPVTGALLHELSSLPVIANSARLIGLKGQGKEVRNEIRGIHG